MLVGEEWRLISEVWRHRMNTHRSNIQNPRQSFTWKGITSSLLQNPHNRYTARATWDLDPFSWCWLQCVWPGLSTCWSCSHNGRGKERKVLSICFIRKTNPGILQCESEGVLCRSVHLSTPWYSKLCWVLEIKHDFFTLIDHSLSLFTNQATEESAQRLKKSRVHYMFIT